MTPEQRQLAVLRRLAESKLILYQAADAYTRLGDDEAFLARVKNPKVLSPEEAVECILPTAVAE